eukprot:SAG11_NODE_11_length_27870_cov_16.327428_11_plen_178_part_00
MLHDVKDAVRLRNVREGRRRKGRRQALPWVDNVRSQDNVELRWRDRHGLAAGEFVPVKALHLCLRLQIEPRQCDRTVIPQSSWRHALECTTPKTAPAYRHPDLKTVFSEVRAQQVEERLKCVRQNDVTRPIRLRPGAVRCRHLPTQHPWCFMKHWSAGQDNSSKMVRTPSCCDTLLL